MLNVLVVDDERSIREALKDNLEDEDYNVFLAEDEKECFNVLNSEPIDIILLDIWLGQVNGIDVLKVLKEDFPNIEVLIISGHADINTAVSAIKIGAFDMIEKPFSLEKILITINNAVNMGKLKKEVKKLNKNESITGTSPKIKSLKKLIHQYAKSDQNVFILGENGVGKELVSREIHENSSRKNKTFVAVNCAAIPNSLIESELFGYQKGAFTGADKSKKGKFELANEGTIFLDEIADLSLEAQAKVLRVIQDRTLSRLGSNKEISIDIRIICATNKDIKNEVKNKKFREDLYYRLFALPILVPPLRERKSDLILLVNEFIKDNPDSENKKIDPEALKLLENYKWPGNVRQLKNVITRVLIISSSQVIKVEEIQIALSIEDNFYSTENENNKKRDSILSEFEDMPFQDAREEFEKQFLQKAFEKYNYNLTRTAKALGIYPSSLSVKIKKHKISKDKKN